jgi:transketolase
MPTPIEDITQAYSQTLVEVGHAYPNVVVLDADIADSCQTEAFHAAFPERAFDLGVAEQSLPTFAAGLALVGKIPIYNSFAVFSVTRGVDMIRQSIAYNRANVKIIGHAAGQSMGYTGPSHHTIADFSIFRAIPAITILSPCDAKEVRQMVWKMMETDGPMYLRLVRNAVPDFHKEGYRFEIGKTERMREGDQISIFVTGDMVVLAVRLHEVLLEQGIRSQVINVPTIKPLEAEEILPHGQLTQAAITIEDHNIYGGLGSAIAEIYAAHLKKPVKCLGIPDTFTESDDGAVLREAYGLNLEHALELAKEALN